MVHVFRRHGSVSREDGAGDAGFSRLPKRSRGAFRRAASGVFNGRRVGLEVAVTNTSRPDGNATPWAYCNFRDPSLLVRVRVHRHAADGAGGQARFSTSPLGHLQPSSSIAFDVSLPSDTFRALGLSVTEALGHVRKSMRASFFCRNSASYRQGA
jgi:hypothetical protein